MTQVTTRVETNVMPYLCADGAADAIEFYQRAFGAVELYRMTMEDGRIGHAEIRIGSTILAIADEWFEYKVLSPATLEWNSVSFILSVPDADASFERAVGAGATMERPLKDEPYGRTGWLVDPFGHRWCITTPVKG